MEATQFKIPEAPKLYEYRISAFKGVDFQTNQSEIDRSRSPDCVNMIRDTVGAVKKRFGYKTQKTYSGRINGSHFLVSDTIKKIIHAGEGYYLADNLDDEEESDPLGEGGDNFSMAQQMNGKLYIVDGTKFMVFDGETLKSVSENAYVPTIIIARSPSGGGTPLEGINLLQPKRIEKYAGDGTTKAYQLTTTEIDATAVTVQRVESNGTLADLTEGTHFSVDRSLGRVNFNSAPPVSPVTGEDNIYITYAKTVEGYADKINKCTISFVYGMNGAADRLILSGNPDFKNYDWFSKSNDFTYFSDLNYCVVGQDNASIMGYVVENGALVTIKDNADNMVNSTVRRFELSDNKVNLIATGSIQAVGALSKYCFSTLGNEPMYLSRDKKITAIARSEFSSERFSQERGYYIAPKLKNTNENTYGVNYDGFYFLSDGKDVFVLDGLQTSLSKDTPYSARQYECFYWPDIGARVMWVEDDTLWFGTETGEERRLYNEVVKGDYGEAYKDDGTPVKAWWTTPFIFTDKFDKKKTFRYIAYIVAAAVRTSIEVLARVDGVWEQIVEPTNEADYFDFNYVDFSKFSFATDNTDRTLGRKIRIKNVDKVQFKFQNLFDEPFSLSEVLTQYTIGGYYSK